MARYDIEEIKDGLRLRLDDIVADRLPAAHATPGQYIVGGLDGTKGKSCCISRRAPRIGAYTDFSTGQKGDVLRLYAELFHGTESVDARVIESAARYIGISALPNVETEADRAARAERHRKAVERKKAQEEAEAEAREKRRKFWAAQWFNAAHSRPGDPVWSYLSATRGIDMAALKVDGRAPGVIRYGARFPFWFNGRKEHHPAMTCQIAGLHPVTGKYMLLGVHATALAETSGGGWDKLPVGPKDSARRIYAGAKGGLIGIWKGGTKTPFTQASAEAVLAITEGVEDALTVALACPDFYVAAAGSLTNLQAVRTPSREGFGEVVICADRDWGKPENAAQVFAFRDRIRRSGRRARVVYPQQGKDMNDWLREGQHTGEPA